MDIKQMLARDMASAEDRKAQVRRDFPWCSEFADQFREALGDGVKARYFREGDKTMGKPIERGNVDAFRMLDLMDAVEYMKSGKKKGVDKAKTSR